MGLTTGKRFVALVGTGQNPNYPLHKIVFWDCDAHKGISEMNYKQEVKSMSAGDTW
jgi:hypothetical protein